jgi:hypothetical protein
MHSRFAIEPHVRTWRSRAIVALAAACGFLVATDVAFASNWTVGLSGGSSGEAASGAISNLTVTAATSATLTNVLYPGGNGDVVVTITNPNDYPVTITALQFPVNTSTATGYTSPTMTVGNLNAGCTALTSGVTWSYSTGVAGSSHTLTTAIVVGASGNANNPLTVTLTDFASMSSASPSTCASTYFSMPSLAGVTATAGGTPVTTTPTSDT